MTDRNQDDPLRQAINSAEQKARLDRYRRDVVDDPQRNTGLPGFDKPSEQTDH